MSAFASQNSAGSARAISSLISLSHLQKSTDHLKFHQSWTPPQARQEHGRTHDHRKDGKMIETFQKTFPSEIGE